MAAFDETMPDEQLVAATLGGDDDAYAQLIFRHKAKVCSVISRITHDRGDLDDLAQEVFVQGYFKLAQFRRDAAFGHWILRIATFKCYDYLRKRGREVSRIPLDELAAAGHEPAAPLPPKSHPDLDRLYAAMAQLSPQERLVLTLTELRGHSMQEAAELTGWSVANVKVRAFRARQNLRKLII